MKKILLSSFLGMAAFSIGACNASNSTDENPYSHSALSKPAYISMVDNSKTETSRNSEEEPPSGGSLPVIDDEPKTFQVQDGKTTLTAQMINTFGDTKILDYPSEWRGQANLTRYDGSAESPFSKEHCEELRKLAEMGGGIFIRNAHHSLVDFSMPFFLTYKFNSTVVEAASSVGLPIMDLNVINPPQIIGNGTLDLRFKDDAISPKSGGLEYLYEQLHFRYRGTDEGDRRGLIVVSGDILCDLAEGNVEMVMEYPIKGEERTVKVIYDNLSVDSIK